MSFDVLVIRPPSVKEAYRLLRGERCRRRYSMCSPENSGMLSDGGGGGGGWLD